MEDINKKLNEAIEKSETCVICAMHDEGKSTEVVVSVKGKTRAVEGAIYTLISKLAENNKMKASTIIQHLIIRDLVENLDEKELEELAKMP